MRIQRPIIVRDNRNLYSDALQMTQAHQEMYECVQPLQAQITFTEDDNGPYTNNFSVRERPTGTIIKGEGEVENLVWFPIVVLSVLCAVLVAMRDTQYAFNDVTLTQFAWIEASSQYKLDYAGDTKPLHCLMIALGLLACSLLLGWQSKRHSSMHHRGITMFGVFVVVAIQVLCIILHCTMFPGGVTSAESMQIFMLTNTSMLILHFATAIITFVIIICFAEETLIAKKVDGEQDNVDPKEKLPKKVNTNVAETEGNFWLCVAEDLNMIVVYAFIFRACNSQISVHDDTATFFDVMCVVVIGFLQHIANILMIFHKYIRTANATVEVSVQTETDKIIKSIARTRALVFFMIAVVTVFLYLRIAPTCEEFPAGIPFELLRSLALVSMISLNTLHSLSFEMQGSKTDKPWDTSPTWKLLTNGLIGGIVAGFLLANVLQHKDVVKVPSQANHYYLMNLAHPA